MTTVHTSEVVSRVTARDRFRAMPHNELTSDPRANSDLTAWVDTYEAAQGNGMAILALHPYVWSFRVEKITERFVDQDESPVNTCAPADNARRDR